MTAIVLHSASVYGENGAQVVVNFSPYERFQRYLGANGKRLTAERVEIVNLVLAQTEPFTADQLCLQLQDQVGPVRVSRSTVYRALLDLAKAGVVRENA